MRAMDSGTVDLIATDPPFNKSKDFHSTPGKLRKEGGGKFQDRWAWVRDVHDEWLDQISDDHPKLMAAIESARHTHSDAMGAFICFMAVRVLEMKRLLKDTGSIFLHCDWTASAYLKMMLDGIFGHKNFRNEIVWCYTGPGSPHMRQFSRKHDTIFWYSNGPKWTFNKDDIRQPYKDPHQRPRKAFDTGGHFDNEAIEEMRERGKILESWWPQEPGNGLCVVPRMRKQNTGYPTQKPIALYARFIKAASNPGDVVLDPFCGCATTLVAAERLERQWVGIDIWKEAHNLVLERLQQDLILDSDEKPETNTGDMFVKGKVHYEKEKPQRTDDGEIAAPYLMPRVRKVRPSTGPRMSKKEMKKKIIGEFGKICQGCFRTYDDERILELDHLNPRSNGGPNDIWNRMILCPPCNQIKGNKLTYQGLLAENKKLGYLAIPTKEASQRSKTVIARVAGLADE